MQPINLFQPYMIFPALVNKCIHYNPNIINKRNCISQCHGYLILYQQCVIAYSQMKKEREQLDDLLQAPVNRKYDKLIKNKMNTKT